MLMILDMITDNIRPESHSKLMNNQPCIMLWNLKAKDKRFIVNEK